MIVTCPNCKTRYRVDMNQISEKGRRVRCRSCRHAWRQLPVDDPEPQAYDPLFNPSGIGAPPPAAPKVPAPKPPPKPKPKPAPPPPPPPPPPVDDPLFGPGPGLSIDPLVDTPLAEDPFESRMARRRMAMDEMPASMRKPLPPKAPSTPLWVWAAYALIGLGLGGGGYGFITFRDQIAMAMPATAKIYSTLADSLGMPELVVNVRGLTFRGVDHSRGYVGTAPYMSVTGAVVNGTEAELDVPPIRIGFFDEAKQLIEVQLARAQAEKVGPNQSVKFGVRLPKVPANVAYVEVAFARPDEIPPGGVPMPAPDKPAADQAPGSDAEAASTGSAIDHDPAAANPAAPAMADPAGMAPANPTSGQTGPEPKPH